MCLHFNNFNVLQDLDDVFFGPTTKILMPSVSIFIIKSRWSLQMFLASFFGFFAKKLKDFTELCIYRLLSRSTETRNL